MKKSKVYDIFYLQDEISFSKGYKVFEEVYEELKDKLNLKREENKNNPWPIIKITKGDK